MDDNLMRERLTITGGAGNLDAELCYSADRDPTHAVLLVNPHPHMGGTMENNVIRHLAVALALAGAATVRFDYRGTGVSDGDRANVEASMGEFWQTGHAPEDAGMIDDATTILQWCLGRLPVPMGVIGYSFGAFAAIQALGTESLPLVMISPTLGQHAFDGPLPASRILVIYSDNDFATPREMTERWIARLPGTPEHHLVIGGQHFFRGEEFRLAERCDVFFRNAIRKPEALC